jgi:hypothetical protein
LNDLSGQEYLKDALWRHLSFPGLKLAAHGG